ncbi:ankyrin repeat domain-containing protein SOWAHC-like isoform X2 [Sinocyclocheilus grahami]|uniref:ankyrin repeat domain-containing protein SOWAHC-like isoform X2 n=1 Tax=Sinocyclocheilus grahami TaxID=75366 RepID=UPI0007AC645F|nr:PREDICTED: ankyrin repeat domain-containing protein SOWAHC-like isoform X2 [Sinocyclocheilus grahami]XP_016116797.1 PREDICTED: ankyrin repeat domain-containing protein SOWAHC-like isoform X2 [Sinocyclocheilus grahami]
MATECNQEAVLHFIKERGGRVKTVHLTDHFRATIPKDPALKAVAKEAFKRHVDSVAYVTEENGEKYVCLKKKFRKSTGSIEKSDRNGPADDRKSRGENVAESRTRVSSEASESRSGGKEAMLPGSGDATAEAGGARTQPDISARFPERLNSRTEPELMGNSSMKINQPQAADKGPRPETSVRDSDGTVCNPACLQSNETHAGEVKDEAQEEAGKENRPQRVRLRRSNTLTEEDQPDSVCDTPKDSRKHLVEALMNRSPQVRRSVCLSGRCTECPRGDGDYEAAAGTLEPLEHEWMLCASDGHWDSLHRLLARDPSLLTRKDFVTGFTCLHWAAKLGKHELIVMLVNFAKAHRVAVNVNARSSAGYTPLHLAATHNHLEVVKLLVGAFDADVEARDYSGRKACQYLKSDIAQNILDIAGACVESDADRVDAGDASRWRLSRVIQSNFRPLKTQNSSEEDGSGLIKQKSLRRKSSFTKMKPSLNKIRMRSQIVHSTSLLDRFEKDSTEESPNLLRPKSNLFG